MADHLSPLALDTLAAGLPVDLPASSHVASCGLCRLKLDALKAERAATMEEPRFKALLTMLEPQAATSSPRWVPVLFAIAAGLLVVAGSRFLIAKPDDTILKGQQTIELLKNGDTPVTQAHVGDKLSIAVGGAGQRAVAAFTLAETGEVLELLPSTPIAPGARVQVGKTFEVTPGGPLAVFACFGDHPLSMDALKFELFKQAMRPKKTPLDALPPAGCAKTSLEVLP
jgi:membrane protein implicated in regulation of membrane protease activity